MLFPLCNNPLRQHGGLLPRTLERNDSFCIHCDGPLFVYVYSLFTHSLFSPPQGAARTKQKAEAWTPWPLSKSWCWCPVDLWGSWKKCVSRSDSENVDCVSTLLIFIHHIRDRFRLFWAQFQIYIQVLTVEICKRKFRIRALWTPWLQLRTPSVDMVILSDVEIDLNQLRGGGRVVRQVSKLQNVVERSWCKGKGRGVTHQKACCEVEVLGEDHASVQSYFVHERTLPWVQRLDLTFLLPPKLPGVFWDAWEIFISFWWDSHLHKIVSVSWIVFIQGCCHNWKIVWRLLTSESTEVRESCWPPVGHYEYLFDAMMIWGCIMMYHYKTKILTLWRNDPTRDLVTSNLKERKDFGSF